MEKLNELDKLALDIIKRIDGMKADDVVGALEAVAKRVREASLLNPVNAETVIDQDGYLRRLHVRREQELAAQEPTSESKEVRALRVAAHALDTMQGLRAFDAAAPEVTFVVDNANPLAVIREALGVNSLADTCIDP